MAFNPFFGYTEDQLLAELKAAQRDLSAGKTTIRAADGNVLIQSEVQRDAMQRIQLIGKALCSLTSPVGTYNIADFTPITTFRTVFSSSVPVTNT